MAKWIFDKRGQASALDCGDSIYDKTGHFRLWIIDHNLFTMYGRHVDWYEEGVFYDSDNLVIGFTRDHMGYLPFFPGYAGEPMIPYLGGKPALPAIVSAPGRPGYSGWSNLLLVDYINQF